MNLVQIFTLIDTQADLNDNEMTLTPLFGEDSLYEYEMDAIEADAIMEGEQWN